MAPDKSYCAEVSFSSSDDEAVAEELQSLQEHYNQQDSDLDFTDTSDTEIMPSKKRRGLTQSDARIDQFTEQKSGDGSSTAQPDPSGLSSVEDNEIMPSKKRRGLTPADARINWITEQESGDRSSTAQPGPSGLSSVEEGEDEYSVGTFVTSVYDDVWYLAQVEREDP